MAVFDRDRLGRGAQALGIAIDTDAFERFEIYVSLLMEAGERMNLTRIPPEEFVPLHLLDSLLVASVWRLRPAMRVIDVGAGAGLPGLALKIAFPSITLTLLEATGKVVDFLQATAEALGLFDVTCIAARAESLGHHPAHREQYDVVTARAVARMPALAEITVPFARVGGCVIACKSRQARKEIEAAAAVVKRLGGELRPMVETPLPTTPIFRLLPMIAKREPTPPSYPRTWSAIRKAAAGHNETPRL